MVSFGGVGGADGVEGTGSVVGIGGAEREGDDNPSGVGGSAGDVLSGGDGSVDDSLFGSRDCDGITDGDGV